MAAIGIGRNEIQWCLITRDLEVTNWASSILSPSKKYDPREFIAEVRFVKVLFFFYAIILFVLIIIFSALNLSGNLFKN